jgi:hypothetical protein
VGPVGAGRGGVATIPWFDHLLRAAGRPDLAQLNASTFPLVLAALVAATVGAVLARRRPGIRWAGCCSAWG